MASLGFKPSAEKVVTDQQIASALHVKVVNATGSPRRSGYSTSREVKDGTGSSYTKVGITDNGVEDGTGSSCTNVLTSEATHTKDDDGTKSNETQVVNVAAPDKCYLPYIAPELLTKIIKDLDEVELTCLSLTCKALYPLHFDRHRRVALNEYVRVGGLASQSSTYTQDGTMLANFLATWVPSHLHYNYEKRKFVTEEKFERFIEDVREELFLEITAEAPMIFKGLDEDDYEDMVDRYMEEAEDMGFEFEDRPVLDPTSDQRARSKRWRRKQRKIRDTRL